MPVFLYIYDFVYANTWIYLFIQPKVRSHRLDVECSANLNSRKATSVCAGDRPHFYFK